MKTVEAVKMVCEAIEEKKGSDIVVLDISKISSFTDYFVICSGFNPRQNQAICDAIRERLKKEDHSMPGHIEGYRDPDWILLDYLDYVVHIFSPEARQFYKLERLWNDGELIDLGACAADS
jgi:ribosome-associated protein